MECLINFPTALMFNLDFKIENYSPSSIACFFDLCFTLFLHAHPNSWTSNFPRLCFVVYYFVPFTKEEEENPPEFHRFGKKGTELNTNSVLFLMTFKKIPLTALPSTLGRMTSIKIMKRGEKRNES